MENVVQILKDAGAILEGHFIGTSGRHLALYINKDVILPKVDVVSKIGRMFAELNKDKNIEVVAAPAVAAIPFSQWTAHHLSEITGREVLSVFTEKTADNGQEFAEKRGYGNLVKGKRVLVVEDVSTTGGSVKKTVEAVQEAGGEVVQTSLMINRDPDHINSDTMGFPLNELGVMPTESWGEGEVPEWLLGVPINTHVGHGAAYVKAHPEAGA